MTWNGECSSHGCDEKATHVVTFKNQVGHVHDCRSHVATLVEWADVAVVQELNEDGSCPIPSCGTVPTWVDMPTLLE